MKKQEFRISEYGGSFYIEFENGGQATGNGYETMEKAEKAFAKYNKRNHNGTGILKGAK